MVKRNASIFISGTGTNLKSLIKNSKEYNFPIKINLIISNNKNALGLKLARMHKIDYKVFDFNSRLQQEILLKLLKKKKIQLICLAGFMKVLSEKFINNFKGNIINIHPSLLPKYKGLNTFSRVLKSKDKFTGCTVHYVNKKLDSGKIILQKKILISSRDNEKSLKFKTQLKEYKAYSEAIVKIYNNFSS